MIKGPLHGAQVATSPSPLLSLGAHMEVEGRGSWGGEESPLTFVKQLFALHPST